MPKPKRRRAAKSPRRKSASVAKSRPVDGLIRVIRAQRVMLDADLAILYEVSTKVLNQAVRRNLTRFPEDFMFQLSPEEAESLRSQFVTSNASRGGRRYLPYAFTEHGVAMLASVLHSPRAIETSLAIVRAFIHMRDLLATHSDLTVSLERLEGNQERTASLIEILAADMDRLSAEIEDVRALPVGAGRKIGFITAPA